jgi:hypothetical protein
MVRRLIRSVYRTLYPCAYKTGKLGWVCPWVLWVGSDACGKDCGYYSRTGKEAGHYRREDKT